MTDTEPANRVQLVPQIAQAEGSVFGRLPDVAHDTAAVARAVGMDDEDGKGANDLRTLDMPVASRAIFRLNFQVTLAFPLNKRVRSGTMTSVGTAGRAEHESTG